MRERISHRRRACAWIAAMLMLLCLIFGYDPVLRVLYPLSYADQVRASAQEFLLDPYLVLALIRTESRFRADAVSPRGARGLMQLMPDTARWAAKNLGAADVSPDIPADNIRLGCWYLAFLLSRFECRTALAAYNAGPGAVCRWLEDDAHSDDGRTLTEIPYEETRRYVQKVQNAYEKYRALYPDFGL